jgi:hypothetical protein
MYNKYQQIYSKVICVARQRENDRIIKRSANKCKTLWQTIKRETANIHNEVENISLQIDSKLVIDPQVISQQFNEFFVNSIGKLIYSNKNGKIDHAARNDLTQNPNVLFLVLLLKKRSFKLQRN